MKLVNKLIVTYHEREVGALSMTPNSRCCAFQYSLDILSDNKDGSAMQRNIIQRL